MTKKPSIHVADLYLVITQRINTPKDQWVEDVDDMFAKARQRLSK